MNAARKKLHNSRGASMLIALMYLLLASMVGTVVLVAAYNNVGRASYNQKEQEEYYAVAAAVKKIQKGVEDGGLNDKDPGTYTLNMNGVTGTLIIDEGCNITVTLSADSGSNPVTMWFRCTDENTWEEPTIGRG